MNYRAAMICAALVSISLILTPSMSHRALAEMSLTGAGSTFDQPFFDKAFQVYGAAHGLSVNYQGVGSGAGIQQFTAKTVDFGATDVPMDPTSELPRAVAAGGPVVQIPAVLGGVVIAYNVPGVKTGLHLSGPVLANIFLGLIKQWNDKAIRSLNPKVKLPAMPIIVVHRSDGSGTSYIFTDYLSKVNDNWRGRIGVGKLPNWPAGLGGKGTDGVAAIIQQQSGAIGYVELAFALQTHMTQAAIENSKKQFQLASVKTVGAAAAAFPKVSANNFSIVNARARDAYPIAGYSWVLLYKTQTDSTKGKALVNLFKWVVSAAGQKYAKQLQYVPLPKNVSTLATNALKTIKA